MTLLRRLGAPTAVATRLYGTLTEQVVRDESQLIAQVYARQKILFTHGEGCYLYDAQGKKYLDFYAGIAVTSLGHGHKKWLQAIQEQAPKLAHVSNLFYNKPAVDLARKLTASCFADRVFFCNSGSEANEGALKFARKYGKTMDPSGKKVNFISFHGGFHGRTMGSLSLTANPKYQKPFEPMVPGVQHVAYNNVDAFKAAMNDSVCGVFVEPIQGEGGLTAAKPEFMSAIRELCDKHAAVMVCDEVQCGLGRTGKLWGYEHYSVKPDIMTVAKALGNGFPIGAILISNKVGDVIMPGDHGSTFAGQPLACQIGETCFDLLSDPAMLKHVEEMGTALRSGLTSLQSPLVKELRGKGLMVGIQIDLAKAQINDVNPILQRCRDEGLVIINAGSDVLRLLPPHIINKEHVDEAVRIFDKVFRSFL